MQALESYRVVNSHQLLIRLDAVSLTKFKTWSSSYCELTGSI